MQNSSQPSPHNVYLSVQNKRSSAVTILSILCLLLLVTTIIFGLIALQNGLQLRQIRNGEGLYDREKLAFMMQVFSQFGIYDMPPSDALTDALLAAFISQTGDKHAAYFDREDFALWQSDLSGDFSGIGVVVAESLDGVGLELLDVFPGSPAEQAGLRVGDILVRLDDLTYQTDAYAEFVAAIAGEKDTTVNFAYLRDGAEQTCTVTRGKIVNRSVLWRIVDEAPGNIGYLRITGFDEHTYGQFKTAMESLEAEGVTGIVFDLRNNGGGLLDTVSRMLAYLLPDGDIVSVHYGAEVMTDYTVRCEDGKLYLEDKTEIFEDGKHELTVPAVVLVNGYTASAAELFTAALRDYAADGLISATVVGETTYGKGTVQTTYPFGDGTGFKLTIAHYDPPCGQNYDGIGIIPAPEHTVLPDEGQEDTNLYRLTYETDAPLRAAVALLCP